jgi:NADP-dependent 3-hydroxy acid dehydrogenase YdfG
VAGLEGKRAVVTGSSSGIGAATVRALEDAGARVTGGSRSTDPTLDVRSEESCRRFVEHAVAELGGLDILVNNAGLALGRDPVWDARGDDEAEVIETNVLGLMRMTRLCLPHLLEAHGHIVNLGSVAGIWSYANGSSYVASKAAVHAYTRALRDDLHGKPVRITNVAPGLVETPFSTVRFGGDEEKARAVYSDVALGGPMRPEDVADCILFALTRPPNVNVDEIVVMALAQTSGANVLRETA